VGDPTAIRERNGEASSRALIEEISGSPSGRAIRRKVYAALRNQGATEQAVEDAFQSACERGVAGACDAATPPKAYAWLQTTTLNAVIDELRRRRPELLVGCDLERLGGAAPCSEGVDSEVIERERQLEIIALARGAIGRLDQRKRNVFVLHSLGRRRPEIAEHLGQRKRVVKREYGLSGWRSSYGLPG
jgi:DNA-directed RNA polymerase specialized sigma24 family protein